MTTTKTTWIDPSVIPDAAHLLHHSNIWCVVNEKGEVAVYDMGTRRNQANALQGNRNRQIAERLANLMDGAVGIALIPHVFLPDSPGRY